MACRLCDGSCAAGGIDTYLRSDMAWLWDQLARAADRRGDTSLTTGSATVEVPAGVAERTAVAGLLGRRPLTPGRRTRVDLAALAAAVSPLTPGVIAAHASGRRLAARQAERIARDADEADLRAKLAAELPELGDEAWAALKRSGWVTRALTAGPAVVEKTLAVIAGLPGADGAAIDRRVLAQSATRDPHALDRGQPVGGLALGLLAALGRTSPGVAPRDAWASVGVAYDDITGGLTVLGVAPAGWAVPEGCPLTLPPRVLASCAWPNADGSVVFVTENPSVLSSAADLAGSRVVCTSGTPSALEVAALARLADAGWQLRVRADFDDAGLNHVAVILAAAPTAVPWRMGADDYLAGLSAGPSGVPLRLQRLAPTPWDPQLANEMRNQGVAVYEEALLDDLVGDISAHACRPNADTPPVITRREPIASPRVIRRSQRVYYPRSGGPV